MTIAYKTGEQILRPGESIASLTTFYNYHQHQSTVGNDNCILNNMSAKYNEEEYAPKRHVLVGLLQCTARRSSQFNTEFIGAVMYNYAVTSHSCSGCMKILRSCPQGIRTHNTQRLMKRYIPMWPCGRSELHLNTPCMGIQPLPSPTYTCRMRKHPHLHHSALRTFLAPWTPVYLHDDNKTITHISCLLTSMHFNSTN